MRGAANSGEPALREMWETSQRQRLTAYRDLTVERGWSQAAYQRWLADTLIAALLPLARALTRYGQAHLPRTCG
jgi:hypothetical protein